MSGHIGITVSIADVARELSGEWDCLFNEMGFQFDENFFERNVGGDELDDEGKAFLIDLAKHVMRKFPSAFS